MNENVIFQKVNIQDFNDGVKIIRNSFSANYLLTSIYSCNGVIHYLEEEYYNHFSTYVYFGLYNNNQIIAFAEFKLNKNYSTAFLNMIAVDKNLINNKLGTLLLSKCIDNLNKKGYKYLELDVYSSNNSALNWYKKLGFQEEFENIYYEIPTNNLEFENQNFDFQILNYPQTKVVVEKFGFGMIVCSHLGDTFNFGIINKNLIIRKLINEDYYNWLVPIMRIFHLNKAYCFGKYDNNLLIERDKVKRLKLALQ
jgi:GNAT superfamily N-acetyltransferase